MKKFLQNIRVVFYKQKRLVLGLVGLGLLSLGIFFFSDSSSMKNQQNEQTNQTSTHTMTMNTTAANTMSMTTPAPQKIRVTALFGTDALVLTNKELTPLDKCQLELNATIMRRGYLYTAQIIKPKETMTIPLNKFIRDNITFNTTTTKAHDVMIMCQAHNGMMNWNYFTNR